MNDQHGMRTKIIIWLTLILALVLQSIPWPGVLEYYRPNWVLLVMFYWVLALPHKANVLTAMFFGLALDLVIGSTLGIRGIVMSVLTYIVATNFQVLRNLALWQQAVVFGLLSAFAEVIEFCGEYIIHKSVFDPHYLWVGVVNCILWPWLYFFLRRVRLRWHMR